MSTRQDESIRWEPYAMHDDGLVGVYTHRALDRGADPRRLATEYRLARWGQAELPIEMIAEPVAAEFIAVGRGSLRGANDVRGVKGGVMRRPVRMMIAAGIALLVLLPIGAMVAGAETPSIADIAIVGSAASAVDLADDQGMDIDILNPTPGMPSLHLGGLGSTGVIPPIGGIGPIFPGALAGSLNGEPADVSISESETITDAVVTAPDGTEVSGDNVTMGPSWPSNVPMR